MPKKTEFPGLRRHIRGSGALYYYDMRKTGEPDLPLGSDFSVAVDVWRRIQNGEPASSFRKPRKVAKPPPIPISNRKPRDPHRWGDMPHWAKLAYASAERRSRVRGRREILTVEDLREVVNRAGGRCEVSGLPLDCNGAGRRPFAPSLDRIDASKGYVRGNVRVVCLMVNQAMSEWGEGPLREAAEAIVRKWSGSSAEVSSRPTRLSA